MKQQTQGPARQAGRELDAEIAVRLFGWRWYLDPRRRLVGLWPQQAPGVVLWAFSPDMVDVTGREGEHERYRDWDRCGWSCEVDGAPRSLPRYSTDVAAALSALEHVAGRKHWRWRIETQEGYDGGPTYFVQVFHGGKVWEGDSQYTDDAGDAADSLPLAICRAALAVVSEG